MAADAGKEGQYSVKNYIELIAECDPTPTHVLLLELMDQTGTIRTQDVPYEAAKAFYKKHCVDVEAIAQAENSKTCPFRTQNYNTQEG